MTVFIDQQRVDDIQVQLTAAQDALDLKQAEIDGAMGEPVEWTEGERLDLMKQATLLAFLSENNLACYPLSVSSVLVLGPG